MTKRPSMPSVIPDAFNPPSVMPDAFNPPSVIPDIFNRESKSSPMQAHTNKKNKKARPWIPADNRRE